MAFISVLIRQFCLPNPFMCFVNAAAINWVAEIFLHPIAFFLVGLAYERGSAPAAGSFLYLVVYSALVGILYVWGIKCFVWWWILLTSVLAIIAILLIGFILNWISDKFFFE